jgi:hypothetical protein
MSLGTLLTLFVVPCVYAVMGWRPQKGQAAVGLKAQPAE